MGLKYEFSILLIAHSRQLHDGADQQEAIALHQRWEEMKPRVIRPLGELFSSMQHSGVALTVAVAIDRVERAYQLAEHHSDLPTLVWLCHDPVSTGGAARLQLYIERFGEKFAFVLYQWYIDKREVFDWSLAYNTDANQANIMLCSSRTKSTEVISRSSSLRSMRLVGREIPD